MARIVIALGGNALGDNPQEQKELVKIAAASIVKLVDGKNEVIIGHGNGPQVGMIYNTFSDSKNKFSLPFPEAGSMSQGYIGVHLLNALKNELMIVNNKNVEPVYFLTQTIVDAQDSRFKNPSKPIGPFYTSEKEAMDKNPNSTIVEDAGRGFRKVVASPLPIDFLGFSSIQDSIKPHNIVIVAGGGGIPTIIENNTYKTVDGVIDKDFALSKFAQKIKADYFIVLTAVDRVYVNYNKPDQKEIISMSIAEAKEYIAQKQFAPGSMLPKVEAAIDFVEQNPKGTAIIAKLEKLDLALSGKTGTKITSR